MNAKVNTNSPVDEWAYLDDKVFVLIDVIDMKSHFICNFIIKDEMTEETRKYWYPTIVVHSPSLPYFGMKYSWSDLRHFPVWWRGKRVPGTGRTAGE